MGKTTRFLYHTAPGRSLLKVLCAPKLSKTLGYLMDSPVSRVLIAPFIRICGIDMTDYVKARYESFNDFFTRQVKVGARPVDRRADALVSPCDGRLTAVRVRKQSVIPVKQSAYTLSELLDDPETAAAYEDGWCLIFRLSVDDYHHYMHIDEGIQGEAHVIPGILHTVQPEAAAALPVYTRNAREWVQVDTAHFGKIIQMEVGAMLVGRICNTSDPGYVCRGQEKGSFAYGGSTVILLVEKDRIRPNKKILKHSLQGKETRVRMGERIGTQVTAAASSAGW